MYGRAAYELVKGLHNSREILPPFNDEGVRQVLEEIHSICDENLADLRSSDAENIEDGVAKTFTLRHIATQRNIRCLKAYFWNRLRRIRQMRWEFGSVLPAEIKANLSPNEYEWFINYNKNLVNYMQSIDDKNGLNLTSSMTPPKSLCIEVRCLTDFGKFELYSGEVVMLKKNGMYQLPRADCETLIRQGILKQI